jgi:hypothetical protein
MGKITLTFAEEGGPTVVAEISAEMSEKLAQFAQGRKFPSKTQMMLATFRDELFAKVNAEFPGEELLSKRAAKEQLETEIQEYQHSPGVTVVSITLPEPEEIPEEPE